MTQQAAALQTYNNELVKCKWLVFLLDNQFDGLAVTGHNVTQVINKIQDPFEYFPFNYKDT